jgi:hypothetical protein
MPPFRYIVMNWEKEFSEEEKKIILNWINSSLKILND